MKLFTKMACYAVCCLLFAGTSYGQQKRSAAEQQLLKAQYGDNFDEVLDKYSDDPAQLMRIQEQRISGLFKPTASDVFRSMSASGLDDIGRAEAEPNNFFDTADAIDDVLALEGRRPEYTGKLIQASLEAGDVDVYKFTVNTESMYYFAATHSFLDSGDDGLNVQIRLFHESDLDTTAVEGFGGVEGNDKVTGDIMGRAPDGRNGSGDFRLTGWVSPVDPATGEKLTGDFYLWVYNEGGDAGTYFMTAYEVPLSPYVARAEPNYPFQAALTNQDAVIPADAVVRTYMSFNPDTVKIVNPPIPVQGNTVYPQLWAQGDEDVDLFRIDYKANHTLTVETMPYFGWYRENDGTIGPGGSRMSDPRIRIYDADFTVIIAEDDDGAREAMDGPNNIESRIVLTPEALAAAGVTEDTPLWLWVGAWASQTRTRTDPGDGAGRNVDNSDPGRFIYDLYATQTSADLIEVEPNNSAAEATAVGVRSDTTYTAAFADGSDADYYRIFMHEVRMYTLFTSNSTVSDDIEVEIFREYESDTDGTLTLSGNLLTESVAGNAGNNDFVVSGFVPEASGAYIVKLSAASAGDYQLGVIDKGQIYGGRIANEPDDVAGDALAQDAMEVGPGAQAKSGMIFPAGDLDHYHFSVDAGVDLTLSIGGSNADLVNDFDVQMTLLAPDGSEIDTSTGGISHTTTESGQYIIQVAAVDAGSVGFYTLSGGQPFEESEPNETFAEANALAFGNIYDAALSDGDVDYYRFGLEAGKLYSFRGLDNLTGSPLSVEFFDEINGTTILDDTGWPTDYSGDFRIANIIPRESKTYYLKISGGAGAYKLTSRVNENYYAQNHKGEPNNNAAEADVQGDYQAFGADVEYVLSDVNDPRFFGDEDWFRVPLASGQTLVAETKPLGGDLWSRDTDTRLVLWNADASAELANDDDGGNDWYSKATYTAASDEVVYVQVRTSRASDADDLGDRNLNRGDYILNIDVTSAEQEPNNDFAEANTLAPGFIDASFDIAMDTVDVYKMNLEADHIYHVRTIRLEDDGFTGGFSAQLFKGSDTATNLLGVDDKGYNTRYSGDNLKLNIIPDETGEYFLHLAGAGGSGAYKIGMKARDITELKAAGEPNNTVAEADAMGVQEFNAPGEVLTSMLYNPDFVWNPGDNLTSRWGDDIDIYKYSLVAGDTMVAETSPVDGPLWSRDYDGFMRLYNAAGDTLDNDDDDGFDWHSRIEYAAEADIDVYVVVHSQDYGKDAADRADDDPTRGEYNLTVTKNDGTPITITDTEDPETPFTFALDQNYPNPFNPTTTISFTIPEALDVELTVYNILGQRVATLMTGLQTAGVHEVRFDASRFASGMYLYRVAAGNNVSVKKMLLVK